MPQSSFPEGLSVQTVFDALPDPCILLDPSGELVGWNTAFARENAHCPDLAQRCSTALTHAPNGRLTVQAGGSLTYCAEISPLSDGNGHIVCLRRLEACEQQLEALRAFGASAGHDLQEPVRKMLAFSSLLSRRYADLLDQDGVQSLEFITDAAQRMRLLINDVLAYIDAGARPLKPERVSLADLMKDITAERADDLDAAEAELEISELPEVTGDPAFLKRVLEALIDNALKFRRGTGVRISVSATRTGDQHRIEVRDNGIGVDPELAGKLFTPFGRLHPRETYPGAALGLALAQQVLDRHGGDIWLEPGAGEGACFVFTLPVSD